MNTEMEPRMAGRGLDAEIAERVMGWTRRKYWCGSDELSDLFPPSGAGSFDDHGQFPAFSTDIAAAFTIMDELARRCHKIGVMNRYAANRVWACSLILFPGDQKRERQIFEYGDTAPLAICNAALKAIVDTPQRAVDEPRPVSAPRGTP